jgi:hypothetical protein
MRILDLLPVKLLHCQPIARDFETFVCTDFPEKTVARGKTSLRISRVLARGMGWLSHNFPKTAQIKFLPERQAQQREVCKGAEWINKR